ncbi:hypothetical protein DVH05_025036 [Phytophthora capsici]|nr:hypothetical protein DVH05_025036 [Phytophthora capsici]
MSFRTTKKLDIPEHVPVGAVIGKHGSYCKALREKYGIRCYVDGDNRKMTLHGTSTGVSGAEEQLVNMFESMEIAIERIFEAAARDGPTHCWSFQKTKETTSDKQVKSYPFRLQELGQAVETASMSESWIKEFREDDTTNFMGYFLKTPSKLPLRLKIAFGAICFKPKSFLCERSMSWEDLQGLRNYDDFATRWTNVCRHSSLVALMANLEEWLEKGVEPYNCLNIHLVETNESQYDMKFHLEDGQWKLLKASNRRHVRGTYDLILNNNTSIRVRACTREKSSDNTAADLHGYLDISIPDDGDFFHTNVVMKETAPKGMHVKGFNIQSKVYAVGNGLRFSICYLDQNQDEFRLECRLTSEEKEKLSATDNEAQVLLEKTLQVLP